MSVDQFTIFPFLRKLLVSVKFLQQTKCFLANTRTTIIKKGTTINCDRNSD